MTRINVGIEPRELPDRLLLAEHREITRIPNAVRSGRAILKDIPESFRLGKGHVTFFYDKLTFLCNRYKALLKECRRRGFQVEDKSTAFESDKIPVRCWGDYTPRKADRQLIVNRIESKGFRLKDTK